MQFLPLDISDQESLGDLLLYIDNTIQYGEDLDVKVPRVSRSSNGGGGGGLGCMLKHAWGQSHTHAMPTMYDNRQFPISSLVGGFDPIITPISVDIPVS